VSVLKKNGIDQNYSVAFIITHTIKAGQEKHYENWLRDILTKVSKFPGYLGREIFPPTGDNRIYTSIVRFDTYDHLNGWAESDIRKSYVNQVKDLLEKGDTHEIHTGIDFWFTPASVKPPKKWKQFLLTYSAVYPLSLIIPRLLAPVFKSVSVLENPFIAGLIISAILTGLLTFVVMPHYTRLVKRWLYKEE
jgi:uncharacterized protein